MVLFWLGFFGVCLFWFFFLIKDMKRVCLEENKPGECKRLKKKKKGVNLSKREIFSGLTLSRMKWKI